MPKPKRLATGSKRPDHMVRLSDRAYKALYAVAKEFCKKVRSNPELYPQYAGRGVTISEVLAVICEEALCRQD